MSAEKMIKKEAKLALSGKWAAAVIAVMVLMLLPIIIVLIISAAYSVLGETKVADLFTNEPVKAAVFAVLHLAAVAALVALSPIYTGFARMYSKAACGKDIDMDDLFYYLDSKQRYKDAVVFMSGILVKTLGIGVVCEAPALAVAFASNGEDSLMYLAAALAMVGLLGAFVWLHRFAFQVMLYCYYECDPVSTAHIASQAAKHETMKLIKLSISFVPWLLLNILIVPFIYLFPYMTCAYFVSTKYLLSTYIESYDKFHTARSEEEEIASEAKQQPEEGAALSLEKTNDSAEDAAETTKAEDDNDAFVSKSTDELTEATNEPAAKLTLEKSDEDKAE